MSKSDFDVPGYRVRQQEIDRMRNFLAAHPDPMDPLCPEYTKADLDEMERSLHEERL